MEVIIRHMNILNDDLGLCVFEKERHCDDGWREVFFLIARQAEPITYAPHTSGEYFPKIFICAWGYYNKALTVKFVDRVGGAFEL
jgi:hypothetical protein